MGYNIARAAKLSGHDVTLISGPTSIAPPEGVTLIKVRSAEDMFNAVQKEFESCCVAIMAAAVADYTPTEVSPTKLPKTHSDLSLTLKRTRDILAYIGEQKNSQIIVGFALETSSSGEQNITSEMRKRAADKLRAKNVDFAVLNNAVAAGALLSEISIMDYRHNNWRDFPSSKKCKHASNLVKIIEAALSI